MSRLELARALRSRNSHRVEPASVLPGEGRPRPPSGFLVVAGSGADGGGLRSSRRCGGFRSRRPNYPEHTFPDGVRIHLHWTERGERLQAAGDPAEVEEEEGLDCVHEMNTINHYIGMHPIERGCAGRVRRGAVSLRRPLASSWWMAALFYSGPFWWAARRYRRSPWRRSAFLARLRGYWLWWFGHNLHEWAAFTVKPFMPTVLRRGEGRPVHHLRLSALRWIRPLSIVSSLCLLLCGLLDPAEAAAGTRRRDDVPGRFTGSARSRCWPCGARFSWWMLARGEAPSLSGPRGCHPGRRRRCGRRRASTPVRWCSGGRSASTGTVAAVTDRRGWARAPWFSILTSDAVTLRGLHLTGSGANHDSRSTRASRFAVTTT